ncbi:hypothetical protein FVE85_6941 [Porphyridium purpureum]|uniref:Pentatricopeptide repeat-containing protein n=1 Tax=Porphyridium purpureum TaxID=35688 RepID=A0A5J4Z6M8_PORPP|nr:hypothetical protein FVE85_6941 [Porphyridium purpureum]|eukprot:POR8965..scf295_1
MLRSPILSRALLRTRNWLSMRTAAAGSAASGDGFVGEMSWSEAHRADALRRGFDPETYALNMALKLALSSDKKAYAAGVDMDPARWRSQVARVLETTDTPFDAMTLSSALMLAKRLDLTPHEKLLFAVRMLQRARADHVYLDSAVMMHVLSLARPCRKVNLVLTVKRMVEMSWLPGGFRTRVRRLDKQAYSTLVTYWSQCDRPALVHESLRELQLCSDDRHPESALFGVLLRCFLGAGCTDAALQIWKIMRSPAFVDLALQRGENLCNGAWVCVYTRDAGEADFIIQKFKEHSITPDARTLRLLVSVYILAADFSSARAQMDWMTRLGYALHPRELYQYLHASTAVAGDISGGAKPALDTLLLTLGDVLIKSAVSENARGQVDSRDPVHSDFLRAYFNALYEGVQDGRLGRSPYSLEDVADTAIRIFEHSYSNDRDIASCMTYLASRAGRLDYALGVAHHRHQRAPREGADVAHPDDALQAFAYEALAERSVAESRENDTLALLFRKNDNADEPPVDQMIVSQALTHFLHAFGRLGRLEICAEAVDSFEHAYGADILVTLAYSHVLRGASRSAEAHDLLKKFYG